MNEVIDDLNALEWNKKFRVWRPFMEKYDCQFVCEVGVRSGRNFEKMIEHGPEEAYAIDIWKDDGVASRNDVAYSQEVLDKQYEDFKERMESKPFVWIRRYYSVEAATSFGDETLDFIYIDADHTYEGVMADLEAWYPKVKKGGFVLGDDFVRHKTRTGVRYGVMEAVTKFANINELSFFVFPRSKWGMIKV